MPEHVKKVRVKNIGGSSVDLDDGRTIAPGEYAEDVNLEHPHNDRLVLAGIIAQMPDADTRRTHPPKEEK